MPRKKRKPVCSNDKRKGKKVKRKTKKQKLIEKLIVGSEWRVATGDTEITSTGKEVLSGWQQCSIVERLYAGDNRWGGSVRVKYTDDADDEDPFEYSVHDFIVNAAPAPVHESSVNVDVASAVVREQPVFVPKERGELIPLQRRSVSNPKTWLNKVRKFDKSWSKRKGKVADEPGTVPTCAVSNCKLQCVELTGTPTRDLFNLL